MKPMSFLTSWIYALMDSGHEAFTGLGAIQYGGDGFLIRQVVPPYRDDLRVPLGIGVALMQCAASTGFTLRAQLSMGESSDVSGTYSEAMQQKIRDQEYGGYLGFYRGRVETFNNMLYNPILGTSIFNAYRLSKPKGPLFVIDALLSKELTRQAIAFNDLSNVLEVDWLLYSSGEVEQAVSSCIGKVAIEPREQLLQYLQKYEEVLPEDWAASARRLVGEAH